MTSWDSFTATDFGRPQPDLQLSLFAPDSQGRTGGLLDDQAPAPQPMPTRPAETCNWCGRSVAGDEGAQGIGPQLLTLCWTCRTDGGQLA